jgi:REP element-mobilizing transposase RayT
VPGACYHVILRGNHRETLFGSPLDRQVLNDIVADVIQRFGIRIHAFCWMSNHLHALVQIAERPLGAIVQRIAMRYSRYRHKAMRTTGHLFERRHKAKLVDIDAYFLTLLRYVHLNPVKARIVADPAEYPWSSHRAYLGTESISWLTTDFGLSLFSTDPQQARAAYEQFVLQSAVDDENLNLDDESHPEDSRVLGTDTFINNIPFIPYKPRSPLTLEQLAESLCTQHSVSLPLLRSASRARHLAPIRILLTTQAIEQRIATLCDVARYLHRDPSSLTKLLARHHYNSQSNGQ